jgi:TrmH family RNA methyltransferase
MADALGRRSGRLSGVRALKAVKGRREQRRFAFEGATLLEEARRSGVEVAELYVTRGAYETTASVRELDLAGTPTFVIDDSTAAQLSDVETPSGILAVAATRFWSPNEMLERDGILLVLADLNDPGNAGTLLRSADAFAALGVVFGRMGVDPYHPKVVRAAMGAIFRVRVGLADPPDLQTAAAGGGYEVIGLTAGAPPLEGTAWPPRGVLVVGHERHGLGRWAGVCKRQAAIRMAGPSESLNAAIAGSIGLYEAARNRP